MRPRTIRQRDIYWLDDCEPLDGDTDKDRPIIILEPDLEVNQSFVLVVACSTHPRAADNPRFRIPDRNEMIETGLPRTCWALPRWYFPINRFRLTAPTGRCPTAIFTPLFQAILAQMNTDHLSDQFP